MSTEWTKDPDWNPPAELEPAPWARRADRAERDEDIAVDLHKARQNAQEQPAPSLRDRLADAPRPSLLGLVGAAHAVLVVATAWYLLATFGPLVALIAGAVYTLAWIVILTQRADERRRLSRPPAPFRRYDYAPPPGEDS